MLYQINFIRLNYLIFRVYLSINVLLSYLGIRKIELLLFKRRIVHCVHTICGVLYALCQASFNPWRHAMPVYWEGPEDADRQSDRAKCLRRRPPAIISDGRWPLRRWAPPLNRPMGHRYQSLALWLHAISLLQNKAPPFLWSRFYIVGSLV